VSVVAEFWIVAGPNGAGKSTLVQRGPLADRINPATFLNPDDVALEILRGRRFSTFAAAPPDVLRKAFLDAANAVFDDMTARIPGGEAVVVETVLSSDKYRPVVESVLEREGFFGLIYVWLDSPETACVRVRKRVSRGGHDVPADKIAARWRRSIENLAWFLPRATRFWIYDNTNSDADVAPSLLAEGGHGKCSFVSPEAPPDLLAVLPQQHNL
jgi:predicted ABC-type ATPase